MNCLSLIRSNHDSVTNHVKSVIRLDLSCFFNFVQLEGIGGDLDGSRSVSDDLTSQLGGSGKIEDNGG